MVLTSDVHLPEESELTVSEVNLSGSTLIASAFHLGKYCENANNNGFAMTKTTNDKSFEELRANYQSRRELVRIVLLWELHKIISLNSREKEYMLCRLEEKDARKCINEGKAVTACTMEFFRKVKQSCLSEFNQYANCVDKSSGDNSFKFCRKTQGVLDTCMLEKLNIERPSFGYFTEARVHDTKRPKPLPEPKDVYPNATPSLPDDVERKPARMGSRFYWMTE